MDPAIRGCCSEDDGAEDSPGHGLHRGDVRQGGVQRRDVEGALHEPQPDQGDSYQASKRQLVRAGNEEVIGQSRGGCCSIYIWTLAARRCRGSSDMMARAESL
jgi:hypothetical protein